MAEPNLESLIQKATNPLNRDDDPNAIQAVWHAVSAEAGNVQIAVRLLAHKIQSPQEREAVQALAVLQACVNNCGAPFHAEIGKFRFLNEMIKLVSPKYLGNHTAAQVKRKVVELLFTWTIDLPSEPKILEAYNMLKKQGVVKEDPAYLGAPTNPEPRPRDKNAVFEDEEKAKLLQKLLQSKNPEDLHKANALIKSMVKEDERKMERASRRIVEVETALNNCGVLDEMLSRQQEGSGEVSQADLDLMAELHTSCTNLRANIYRLVSEMDEKEEGIGDLLKANDELSRVMGRYRLVIDGNKEADAASGSASGEREADGKEVLLDLSTPEDKPADTSTSINIINQDLQDLGLGGLNISENSPAVSVPLSATPIAPTSLLGDTSSPPVTESMSIMDELGSVFSPPTGLPTNSSILATPLLPESSTTVANATVVGNEIMTETKSNPLDALDILASATTSTLGLQNLNLANTEQKSQFKTQEKLSMNQLKQQQLSSTLNTLQHSVQSSVPPASTLSSSPLLPMSSLDPCGTSEVVEESSVMNLDLLDALGSDSNTSTTATTSTTVTAGATASAAAATTSLLDDFTTDLMGTTCNSSSPTDVSLIDNTASNTTSTKPTSDTTSTQDKRDEVLDASVTESSSNTVTTTAPMPVKFLPKSGSSNAQLMDVKPMTDIKVDIQTIKPGKQSSLVIIESNDITVTLHFTENQPRDDVSVVVVSTMSMNSSPLANYVLQAVVPKGCKVRLQAPSLTELAGYSPFLPPPAVTQIMLIANPNKLNVSLKVMLSYTQDDDPMTEMGEVDTLPL